MKKNPFCIFFSFFDFCADVILFALWSPTEHFVVEIWSNGNKPVDALSLDCFSGAEKGSSPIIIVHSTLL